MGKASGDAGHHTVIWCIGTVYQADKIFHAGGGPAGLYSDRGSQGPGSVPDHNQTSAQECIDPDCNGYGSTARQYDRWYSSRRIHIQYQRARRTDDFGDQQ